MNYSNQQRRNSLMECRIFETAANSCGSLKTIVRRTPPPPFSFLTIRFNAIIVQFATSAPQRAPHSHFAVLTLPPCTILLFGTCADAQLASLPDVKRHILPAPQVERTANELLCREEEPDGRKEKILFTFRRPRGGSCVEGARGPFRVARENFGKN